jgi:hypothetical protein
MNDQNQPKILPRIFRNGFGTRALLATVVVGGAVGLAIYAGAVDQMYQLALLVIGFYFGDKARNGAEPK